MSATPEPVTPAPPAEIAVTESQAPSVPLPGVIILGYPHIGRNRELKRAVESLWKGNLSVEEPERAAAKLCGATCSCLTDLRLTQPALMSANFTLYNQVLQVTTTLGAASARLRNLLSVDGALDVKGYFALVRGEGTRLAMKMTKRLDSNYRYLIPKIDISTLTDYVDAAIADQVRETKTTGTEVRPVVVGPVNYLLVTESSDEAARGLHLLDRLSDILYAYGYLPTDLHEAGTTWVQLDEPALVSDSWNVERQRVLDAVRDACTWLNAIVERLQILMAGAYGSLGDTLPMLAQTPVEAVGLGLVVGVLPEADDLTALEGKTVAAGAVSGRSIWRTDLDRAMDILEQSREHLPEGTPITVATSISLQCVSHDVKRETAIDPEIRSWLASADQKVGEVIALAKNLEQGRDTIAAKLSQDADLYKQRTTHPNVRRDEVRAAISTVMDTDRICTLYGERRVAQDERFGLSELPTATIGSFPQAAGIRRVHIARRKDEVNDAAYGAAMHAEIASVVTLQERLGLGILVHDETERNDMIQYFAELPDGSVTTEHGWVQPYSSCRTRPFIPWDDVTRPEPMAAIRSTYTQSLADRPLKGMLAGPAMAMAWSSVCDDIPRTQVADQLDLALCTEVADPEAADIGVIRVDESVIRETLLLRRADRPTYLEWPVGSLRLTTEGATPVTRIYTHLHYSEFDVAIDTVGRLDTDVTPIEISCSRMGILPTMAEHGFEHQLGPDVWDICFPCVSNQAGCTELLQQTVDTLGVEKVWVNLDRGLETHGYTETKMSLISLVSATRTVYEA